MNNENHTHSNLARLLHWIIGTLFLFQFLKLFDRVNNKQNFISEYLLSWHDSIGLLLLVIVSIRIIWILPNWKTQFSNDTLHNSTNILLYLFMLLAPLSAILLNISKGHA